ncbi:MAG TPA: toast rack family protein, partial [Leptolinea sp.]
NIPDWKPAISHSDERVTITQGKQDNSVSFPAGNLLNSWDLKLGTEKPISLEIDAGAYKSNVVIGAIPLSELKIEDGASQSKITFDKHNKQSMETFTYHTGASQVDLINLANANFKEMNFESGAGSYTLDFNGDLQQKATVTIKSGLSNMKIIIPTGTNASVNLTGGVNNVSLKGTWTINSNQYKTQSSRGPLLAIDINMGVGNLELISSDGNSI